MLELQLLNGFSQVIGGWRPHRMKGGAAAYSWSMSEENVAIVRRLYTGWELGDLRAADFFHDEIEHSRIGSELPGINGEWRGMEALGLAMASYLNALADLRIKAERVIDIGGDRVLVLSRHIARGKTSGLPFEHELGDLFTLSDGKVLRYVSYWDRADALEAAGLSD